MRTTAIIAAVATALLGLVPAAEATAAAAAPAGVDGFWRTDGYGTVVAIRSGHLTTYDTTAVSCLPGELNAEQAGPPDQWGAVRFNVGGVLEATVTPTGRDRGHLQFVDDLGIRHLRRLPALPGGCGTATKDDPVRDFDVFWQTFEENYPFFAARRVNWRATRARYRPMVNEHTSKERLFTILTDMIKPLNDRHTGLMMDRTHFFVGSRPGTRAPSAKLRDQVNKVTAAHLRVPLTTWGNGLLRYGDLPGHLGYLQLQAFGEYTAQDTFEANSAVLDKVLNSIFTRARVATMRGLIIDVRYNLGGDDPLGLSIAARLTHRPYVAFAKRARNDGGTGYSFTTPQPITVHPATTPVYSGPVAVLTSDLTISAGETFTQALMGRTPAPVRIGTATQGVFSDEMARHLPNGWLFELPNEEYLTAAHTTFDGTGIPPDITTPVFTPADLAHDRDSAVDRAVTLLSSAR